MITTSAKEEMMSKGTPWEQEEVAVAFNRANRTINNLCPPLRAYLAPGARVLDVGCGSGRFSRDVAVVIAPGKLTAVDHSQRSITLAQQEATKSQLTNVEFRIGDAYGLEFENDTFDLAYSINVAVWLQDPVRALQEQRRLTKLGGWVAVQMADYGNIIWYPPTPALDRLIKTLSHVREFPEEERLIDSHQARRFVEIMAQAGLENVRIDGWAIVHTANSERFDEHYETWRTVWLDPTGIGAFLHQTLLSHGLVDESIYAEAQEELDAWHVHPHAVYLQTAYLVAGQVI